MQKYLGLKIGLFFVSKQNIYQEDIPILRFHLKKRMETCLGCILSSKPGHAEANALLNTAAEPLTQFRNGGHIDARSCLVKKVKAFPEFSFFTHSEIDPHGHKNRSGKVGSVGVLLLHPVASTVVAVYLISRIGITVGIATAGSTVAYIIADLRGGIDRGSCSKAYARK
jgi:hypothetical protein